jgi:alpha-methylacyl-CoA racemase
MGTLDGIRVIELAGIGPAPFGGMLLADMGAEVLRIDRIGGRGADRPDAVTSDGSIPADVLNRGKQSLAADLKNPVAVAAVLRMVEQADVFIESYRPGVAERLGLGPDECTQRNGGLIYARMTGWGQEGQYAPRAGHDVNYLALAGVLAHVGRPNEPPPPPLNLVGDFGGGGMLLGFGVACALVERSRSGRGQILDVAMVDGTALLSTQLYGLREAGMWHRERGRNLLDGGAPYYDTYVTADGRYVAVGAMEPQFYAALLNALGLPADELPDRDDVSSWRELKARFADVFATKTRAEWAAELENIDACVTPVLDIDEAHRHPHNAQRGTFGEHWGVMQPEPAPRFSRTPGRIGAPPPAAGRDTGHALQAWGFQQTESDALRAAGAVV